MRDVWAFQWQDVATTTTAWPHSAGVLSVHGKAKPSYAAARRGR